MQRMHPVQYHHGQADSEAEGVCCRKYQVSHEMGMAFYRAEWQQLELELELELSGYLFGLQLGYQQSPDWPAHQD